MNPLPDKTTFTVHEAKTHLSRLIAAALEGREIVIARGRQPAVKLVPVADHKPVRAAGAWKHLAKEQPGAWDPWTDEELGHWEDKPL